MYQKIMAFSKIFISYTKAEYEIETLIRGYTETEKGYFFKTLLKNNSSVKLTSQKEILMQSSVYSEKA